MSARLPPINRWLDKGWEVEEIIQPARGSFQIEGNGTYRVPTENHIYKCEEGFLMVFSGTFDHPRMGIRVEYGLPGNNELDIKNNYTVENYGIGSSVYDPVIYSHMPPDVPYGLYLIKRRSRWLFTRWLRMSLINNDTSSHWVLGYGYHLLLARRPLSKRYKLEEMK